MVEAPLAKAASGKLGMRQRRSARVAAGSAVQSGSGKAKGISGGIGLDSPYQWGQ